MMMVVASSRDRLEFACSLDVTAAMYGFGHGTAADAIRRTASIGGVAHTHDEYLDGEEDDYDDPDDLDDGESTPDLAALDLGEGG